MPTLTLQTKIHAPLEKCFDLARNIDLHVESNARSRERAVAGKTTGFAELGDTITWKARHFGFWFKMTVKITGFQPPHSFTDEMVKGPFKMLRHVHEFESDGEFTLMTDRFTFRSPLGVLGQAVDALILKRYLTNFLKSRNEALKKLAERTD